jgi:hypothetical protein
MLLGLGMIHSHFSASHGPSGVYTTVSANEVITFDKQLNTIEITAVVAPLEIKFNNDEDSMYIASSSSDGIVGMPVNRIIVVGAAGQKLKWRGLVGINNT